MREGLVEKRELAGVELAEGRVDYRRVRVFKEWVLAQAWERFRGRWGHRLKSEFERFCGEQSEWLDDFALFMALREAHGGRHWAEWGEELARRRPGALKGAKRELAEAVGRHRFTQFLFDRQLQALRGYAGSKGVRLIGDLPIFVSADSADVWGNRGLFLLDGAGRPKFVAGVPPDYFSRTGQRWGNPVYDWGAMRRQGFAWWVSRLRAALRQVDVVRIDHFRGFEAYWRIPAGARTAERGRWVKAPGEALFETLRRKLGGLPFIAEDLGLITAEVEALRESFGLPGMRVLQFAFGGGAGDKFLPHNHERNTVVYTGTHDNDTTAGWFASLSRGQREVVRRYAPEIGDDAGKAAWGLLRMAWSSVADLAVAPLQDVLGLGSSARMNRPGTARGNWRWRFTEEQVKGETLDRLRELTSLYNRG
jgi:4-alpha-glucanotransferase